MGFQVCSGATLQCSLGSAPSSLVVLPLNQVFSKPPAASILDHVPLVNILPFGVCSSPSNPTVAAATAAALGVLTPMPCVPATAAPWTPGSLQVTVGGAPALESGSTLTCMYGGLVKVTAPGQGQVDDK
jgi:hypothetical protein